MTVYFHNVLSGVAKSLGLRFHNTLNGPVARGEADILFVPDSLIDGLELSSTARGTHIIRDPRDLIVSAYFYHLKTDEDWCRLPNPATGLPQGVSYQQHLAGLDREAGLLYEMCNVSGGVIEAMGRWDYADPRFLELRYEEVLGNEKEQFERVFSWYGLDDKFKARALKIAGKFALDRSSRKKSIRKHIRSGSRIGQWEDFFTPRLNEEFQRRYGQILVRLGYQN
jgi:hypothetical protein